MGWLGARLPLAASAIATPSRHRHGATGMHTASQVWYSTDSHVHEGVASCVREWRRAEGSFSPSHNAIHLWCFCVIFFHFSTNAGDTEKTQSLPNTQQAALHPQTPPPTRAPHFRLNTQPLQPDSHTHTHLPQRTRTWRSRTWYWVGVRARGLSGHPCACGCQSVGGHSTPTPNRHYTRRHPPRSPRRHFDDDGQRAIGVATAEKHERGTPLSG